MFKDEKSNVLIIGLAFAFIGLAFFAIFFDFATKLLLPVSFCSCCISFGEFINNGESYTIRALIRNLLYIIGMVGLFLFLANIVGEDFLNIGTILIEKLSNIFTFLAFACLFFTFRKTDQIVRWKRK